MGTWLKLRKRAIRALQTVFITCSVGLTHRCCTPRKRLNVLRRVRKQLILGKHEYFISSIIREML